MRLTLNRSGGFLGAPLPARVVDTGSLEGARRAEIESLVQAADFFALPANLPPSGLPQPDRFQYDLQVEESGGRIHRVRFGEDNAPEPLLALARTLRAP